jgi:uncharacterized protein (TIRG00374 family)
VLIALAVGVGGALAYVNPHVRRLVRFDAVLSRLPLGEKLKQMDSAVQAYARHPTELAIAVVCSLWNHACVIFGVWALGQGFGLGDQVDVLEWFAIVPIANIAAAVPLFPGGWGIGEFAYRLLFELIGEPPALGVAVSAAFRLCQVVLSLFGGLFLLAPKNRAELDRIEATA